MSDNLLGGGIREMRSQSGNQQSKWLERKNLVNRHLKYKMTQGHHTLTEETGKASETPAQSPKEQMGLRTERVIKELPPEARAPHTFWELQGVFCTWTEVEGGGRTEADMMRVLHTILKEFKYLALKFILVTWLLCFRKATLIMVWKTYEKQNKLGKKARYKAIFKNRDESEK